MESNSNLSNFGSVIGDKEVEIKAIQWNWHEFPKDVLQAMIEKREHPQIGARSRIEQLYLPTTHEVISQIVDELNKRGIPFGTSENQEKLAKNGAAREVRIMLAPDLCVHKLTIKGHPVENGMISPQIETPKALSAEVAEVIASQKLIEQVRSKISKVWHDIYIDFAGERYKIEHNICTSLNNLIINEIEITPTSDGEAMTKLISLAKAVNLRAYLAEDVTTRADLKSYNLAQNGMPDDIREKLDRQSVEQNEITAHIVGAFRDCVKLFE